MSAHPPQTLPVARDLMTADVMTFPPDLPLTDAWQRMARQPFTGVPVVHDGVVVGMLSETDVLHALASAAFDDRPAGAVRDAMHQPVLTARPTTDLFALAGMMRANRVRRLPVVDGGALIGLVTVRDLDRALLALLEARDAEQVARHPAGAAWDPTQSAARDRRQDG